MAHFNRGQYQQPIPSKEELARREEVRKYMMQNTENREIRADRHNPFLPRPPEQDTAPQIKREIVKLDGLKIQGLRELCEKNNLNTSRCKLRKDYVELLMKNGIGV